MSGPPREPIPALGEVLYGIGMALAVLLGVATVISYAIGGS